MKPLLGFRAIPLGELAQASRVRIVIEELESQQFLQPVAQRTREVLTFHRRLDDLEHPGVPLDMEPSILEV